MKPSSQARQVALLKAAFPREPVSQETIGVYVTKLLDIDGELLAAAVNRLIEESKFFPTIAEIRKAAARLAGLLPPTAAEALAVVRRADRRETVYRRDGSAAYVERFWDWPEDATPELIDLCCETIQRVGEPVNVDTGEDYFAWDSGFREAYAAQAESFSGKLIANLSTARLLGPAAPKAQLAAHQDSHKPTPEEGTKSTRSLLDHMRETDPAMAEEFERFLTKSSLVAPKE